MAVYMPVPFGSTARRQFTRLGAAKLDSSVWWPRQPSHSQDGAKVQLGCKAPFRKPRLVPDGARAPGLPQRSCGSKSALERSGCRTVPVGRQRWEGPVGLEARGSALHRVRRRKTRRLQGHLLVAVTAKLELEAESGGAGPPAAAQQLLQASAPEPEPKAVAVPRTGSALRWLTTAVLYASFLGMGLIAAVLGPTFQDLARNVNQNMSSLSQIFVGRALGYLGGCALGGVLFDRVNHFLLLGVLMLATSVAHYLIPLCKTAALLIVMMCVTGIGTGVLDTGGNILILILWGDQGAPHMQALHFSFALGAFLTPLLAKVALGTRTTVSAENHTELDLHPPALNQSLEADPDLLFAAPDDLNLLWAYAFISTYIFIISVFLLALFFNKSSRHHKSTASAQASRRAKHHKALLCLLFLFFFFYVGAEVTYSSYIFSFATTHVGMEESEAAGLNSIFWGTFAACRGLAIFFATCLQPGTMIVLSNTGSLVSCLFLVLFNKSPICLWIASSVYGASMAATFPSGVSWLEQYTSISGISAAFILIGAALGVMAIPAGAGILQGQYPDLPVVLYTCLGSTIFIIVLFAVMYKLATISVYHQPNKNIKSEKQKALSSSSRLGGGKYVEECNEVV
ncbi:sodium-dependent glucose transporter 1B-like [Octodon degus]|uniref:Sodium-dependent glucose transporter 1B-like n=1 Tax=Octodon degus TaxID=10160 RepID=A0A6P3VCM3_OCTDE|nr:sodium-dependent glucose transporter 1B-like [Octodon degus]